MRAVGLQPRFKRSVQMSNCRAVDVVARLVAVVLAVIVVTSDVLASDLPALRPELVEDESGRLSKTDQQVLVSGLGKLGPTKFKLLMVETAGSTGIDTLLDEIWAAWRLPPESVLFLVTAEDGYRIRFFLGSQVTAWGISPTQVTAEIGREYGPEIAAGRPVQAILALANAIHRHLPATVSRPVPIPSQQPQGVGRGLGTDPVEWLSPEFLTSKWAPWALGVPGFVLSISSLVGYLRRRTLWRHLTTDLREGAEKLDT